MEKTNVQKPPSHLKPAGPGGPQEQAPTEEEEKRKSIEEDCPEGGRHLKIATLVKQRRISDADLDHIRDIAAYHDQEDPILDKARIEAEVILETPAVAQ